MTYKPSASYYEPCWMNILHIQRLISSLTSVSSVKMSHTTDSVNSALRAVPVPMYVKEAKVKWLLTKKLYACKHTTGFITVNNILLC